MAGTTLLAIDRQRSVLRGQATPHRCYTPYAGFQPDAGPWLAFSDAHLDQASGCYLLGNGHRAYSPQLMRFRSPDRLSPFAAGGFNAYAYCLGDPINYRDPTGQEAQEASEYLFPILSILTNLTGFFTSGLKLRSMLRTRQAHRGMALQAAAVNDTVGLLPVSSRSDWALSVVSGASAVAGITVGISRLVEPGKDWQTWALSTLTVISLGTSVKEVWDLAQAKPWLQGTPEMIGMNRWTLDRASQRSLSAESRNSIRQGAIRNTQDATRKTQHATGSEQASGVTTSRT